MNLLEPRWIATLALVVLAAAAAPQARSEDRGADGSFDTRRSSHFVLHQDVDIDQTSGWRGSVRFEREVLGILEAARDELHERLGLRPRRTIDVWVYDPAAFDRAFAGLFRFPAAGFYHGAIRVRGGSQLTQELARVLHHELVHAAFDAAAPSYAPPGWVHEGIASWFENRAVGKRRLSSPEWHYLAAAERRGAWLPLSSLGAATFAALDPTTVQLAYLESYAAVDYLVRLRGERSVERFVDALLRTRNVDRALARVYRLSTAELEEALRAELR